MPDDLIQTFEHEPELHIASLVVQARPDALPQIKNWVGLFPGAEIGLEDMLGKLVVVLETDTEHKILELLDGLNEQAGVFSAALVYHEILTAESSIP